MIGTRKVGGQRRLVVLDVGVRFVIHLREGVAFGAEIVFLIFAYRVWNLPVAILAGAGAALTGGINNLLLWFAGSGTEFTVIYLISTVVSGAVIAGLLSWLLARGLAATGALDRFASGRAVRDRV